MSHKRQYEILEYIKLNPNSSITQISNDLKEYNVSKRTLNRDIKKLIDEEYITTLGDSRGIKYQTLPSYNLIYPISLNEYFKNTHDNDDIRFNKDMFKIIKDTEIFNKEEKEYLESLNKVYLSNRSKLSETILKREIERVTIELSWKSSQIEGNTYNILETETLIKDGIPSDKRNSYETQMLVNHKHAIDEILSNTKSFKNISIANIEYIHSILVKDLGISKNIRKSLVGITGTSYKPLDNEFEIKIYLKEMCKIINQQKDIYTKAFLALSLISYIQPFEDGNKRTSRIVANSILISNGMFPLPLRSLNVNEYRESMIVFYEIGNIYNLKRLFIEQCEYTVKNYFKYKL